MEVRVKICGVRSAEDAHSACEAGASAVGFVFAPSERRVTPAEAAAIAADLPPSIETVAVFRHPSPADVARVLDEFRPDTIQGEVEDREPLDLPASLSFLPVFHDGPELLAQLHRFLNKVPDRHPRVHLEGSGRGGRGVPVNRLRAARAARCCSLVLAGGLDPSNVARVIAAVRPDGVDVSSGVESAPGIKDAERIRDFVNAVRRTEEER